MTRETGTLAIRVAQRLGIDAAEVAMAPNGIVLTADQVEYLLVLSERETDR